MKNRRLDDMMWSLRNFEMNLMVKEPEKKNKGVDLKAKVCLEVEDEGDI